MAGFQPLRVRAAFLVASCALLTACAINEQPAIVPAPETPASNTLTILHINDHHSHLDESAHTLPATATGGQGVLQGVIGGFARVATSMRELAPEDGALLRLHAGDAITGDLHYLVSQGEADARLMNAVCFDAYVLGNHEFDQGDAGLASFLEKLSDSDCQTAVLSANARFGAASPLHPSRAPDWVQPSVMIERDGMQIGVIGVSPGLKILHSSRPDPGTSFEDERSAVQAEIDALRARDIQHIVVLSHLGYRQDIALARALDGVDIIVGGDSHSLLGPPLLERYGYQPEGPYPTVEYDVHGRQVCIVQAWQYGLVVGRLKADFNDQGEVLACRGTPYLLVGDSYTNQGSALDAAAQQQLLRQLRRDGLLRVTQTDPEAVALLHPYQQAKQSFGRETIIEAQTDLCLRRIPGARFDTTRSTLGDRCNADPHVIAHGGDVQQWAARAFLHEARQYLDADISLINGGSVRIDLPAGPVSVTDIYTTQPFRNTMLRLTLTGSEIRQTLEQLAEYMFQHQSTGGYPYAAGLSWELDLNQPPGQRFSQLTRVADDGSRKPLVDDQDYHLVTTDFVAAGSDGYGLFKTVDSSRRLDIGLGDAEILLAHLRDLQASGGLFERLPTSEYSTQRFIDLR